MKKLLLVLILLVIGGLVWFKYFAGKQAADYISKYLTQQMEVPVLVGNVQFKKDSFIINNFNIANPPGTTLPTALHAKETIFVAPYLNYLKQHIVIDQVAINNLYVNIEFYDKKRNKGNWTTIIQNMEKAPKKPAETKKKEKQVLIKYLVARNINIDLVFPGKAPIHLSPIKQVEFRNVSSEKGLPMEEITQIITRQLINQISIIKGLQNMIEEIFQIPLAPFKFLGKSSEENSAFDDDDLED